jgi:hypothetical protein
MMTSSRLEELKAKRAALMGDDKLSQLKAQREALIAQRDNLEPSEDESKQQESPSVMGALKDAVDLYTAPVRGINRGTTDIGAGIATGLENVIGTASELLGHPYSRTDMGKMAGIKDPNLADVTLQKTGQYLPGFGLGGAGLIKGIAGAGLYGVTQAKEGSDIYEKSTQGLTDALLAALTMGTLGVGKAGLKAVSHTNIGKSILNLMRSATGVKPPKYSELGVEPNPADAFKIQTKFGEPPKLTQLGEQENPLLSGLVKFGEGESQFANQERSVPESLKYNQAEPEKPLLEQESISPLHGIDVNEIPSQQKQLAENVYEHLSGGRNLDEAAQYNAAHMKKTFEKIEKVGNKKYENIFHAPEFLDETGKPKTFESLLGDKETKQNWMDMADSENKTVFNNFVTNPTLNNAQKAKTELAVEKRDFQKRERTLTPEERIRYNSVIHRHDVLEDQMNSIINTNTPHLQGELQNANQYWRENVANWYDKNLFRIVKGRETNPSSSTIAGIFKNPEPGTLKVANELGEEGKRGILLHGIGKARGNYSPKLIKNILPALEEKGLLPHITPQFRSQVQELENISEHEKNLSNAILRHQKETGILDKRNANKLTEYEKSVAEHERQKRLNEQLLNHLKTVEPSSKALPNYKAMQVSYPKAAGESEKIVAKAGEKHEKLNQALVKHLQKIAENKAKAAEHTAAIASAAATSLLTPKSLLTAYKIIRTGQRGIGKIARASRKVIK